MKNIHLPVSLSQHHQDQVFSNHKIRNQPASRVKAVFIINKMLITFSNISPHQRFHFYETQQSYIKSKFVAPPDPHTRNGAIIVFTKEYHTSKSILSHFIETLKHSCKIQLQKVLQ